MEKKKIYDEIVYLNEDIYLNFNNRYLKKVIDLFLSKTNLNELEIRNIYEVKDMDYLYLFNCLKDYIFRCWPEYISLFYELLEYSGFDMTSDIVDQMYILGYSTNQGLSLEHYKQVMLSPFIDEIEYISGKIIIYSERFGMFSFYAIRDYFDNNLECSEFIKKNSSNLTGNCHRISWAFLNYLKDASLITELLPHFYRGTYYHSVIRDEKGLIVDLANEIVYDEDIRTNLFASKIVCETKKKDLKINLEEAIKASNDLNVEKKYNSTLLLALYRQAKNERKI